RRRRAGRPRRPPGPLAGRGCRREKMISPRPKLCTTSVVSFVASRGWLGPGTRALRPATSRPALLSPPPPPGSMPRKVAGVNTTAKPLSPEPITPAPGRGEAYVVSGSLKGAPHAEEVGLRPVRRGDQRHPDRGRGVHGQDHQDRRQQGHAPEADE